MNIPSKRPKLQLASGRLVFSCISGYVRVCEQLKRKEEEEEERSQLSRKDDENCVLPGCQFAALMMLSGDVDALVGESSVRIWQARVLKCVKPIPSRVIVV